MQKFNKYDHVKISETLHRGTSHFPRGREAVVLGSYSDLYGGGREDSLNSYALFVKGMGYVAWYWEGQLELIAPNVPDKLNEFEIEVSNDRRQKQDLDWIFSNGLEVLRGKFGSSIEALASCLEKSNLWGSSGEGVTYYMNSLAILIEAEPFLKTGDKAGWLAHCESVKPRD